MGIKELRMEEAKELLETHSEEMTAKILGVKVSTIKRYKRGFK